MSLPKLQEFFVPDSGSALIGLLQRFQGNALIVGGGTFVHGLSARGLLTEVEALIDIRRLGLSYIRSGLPGLTIGASTTFAALQAHPELNQEPRWGAIEDALEYPPVQIRNSATIGGSVAASCPFFDLPVSLLALDATVRAQGPDGPREMRLEAFFTGLFENALKSGEFITELWVPSPAGNSASAFIKLEANANDLAILNAAVCYSADAGGKCSDARVFVSGGVGETPVRAVSAEAVLRRQKLSEELFARAAQAAQAEVEPMTDHRASAAYRKAMTRVLVERALKRAAGRLSQSGSRT